MQYQVFVQSQSDQQFIASIVGIPNCIVEGNSREEAIVKAKTILEEKLAHGEIVTIEIGSQTINPAIDPWLKHLGVFEHDPTFNNFLEEVAAYRQQVDGDHAPFREYPK
ncbi:type II toxin-antitoxin system HicB family antitoxin [Pantanalinema rosaneae CENA516]|uniref:type II toxin-antitoxin system HicB family antitoxin n=1 Tax=Pantanalinema rosaneae TaxID=1620701 RepID=UPI003D6DF445